MTNHTTSTEPHSCAWCRLAEVDSQAKTDASVWHKAYEDRVGIKVAASTVLQGATSGCHFFQDALALWESRSGTPSTSPIEDWSYRILFFPSNAKDKKDDDISVGYAVWTSVDDRRLPRQHFRVITGEDDPATRCKLHQCLPGTTERYATFSYSWGNQRQAVTLTDTNKTEWCNGGDIPFSDLPNTIKDAIKGANFLGISFLWVDSLCVLQDDEHEKALEIAKMSDIFHNAVVTISAARASQSTNGFLGPLVWPEPDIETFKLPYIGPDRSKGSITLFHCQESTPWGTDRPFDDPIDKRAWCMQEHILSPRVIKFGNRGMHWTCRTWQEFEATRTPVCDVISLGEAFSPIPALTDIVENEPCTLENWMKLIEPYSSRRLTDAADALPALSGIAQFWGRASNDEYLAGHWRSHLPIGLLWFASSILSRRPIVGHGPSWSWASMNDGFIGSSRATSLSVDPACQVLECSIEPVFAGLTYGKIKSGALKMRGRMVPMMWKAAAPWLKGPIDKDGQYEHSMDWRFVSFKEDTYYASDDEAGRAMIPFRSEQSTAQGFVPVYCLQIALYNPEMDCGPAGLVLTRNPEMGFFQRIGMYIYDSAGVEGQEHDGFPCPRDADFCASMREEQQRGLRDIEPSELTIV
ncbi:hypothetical protein H2200_004973 [Cladophialophora chaetospira]|uniref:Heterokaryon incompatibility domain-containing protein n=1 Tax=Cladophialophora chaetospira TaxID=386627 RepID=A0AA38XBP8_9EURO|nr:hypothetical protein H2200_004973 [Cladophialophora chaetospira]